MAIRTDSNRGILPTPTGHQNMGRLPVDPAIPFELSPSYLEPKKATSSDVFGDIPWDVGPSFAYFPTHCPWRRTWNLSSASTRDANSPPPLSPDSLEGTTSISSGDSVSSEISPPVSYGAYLFTGHSGVDDIWGLQEFSPQGFEPEHEALPMPFSPGHIWDTIETPPFSRVSAATGVPKSENGLQETRPSHSSATPRRSTTPIHGERWVCGECHKHFQDKTALKYALPSHSLHVQQN
jgi:hypothetical protein